LRYTVGGGGSCYPYKQVDVTQWNNLTDLGVTADPKYPGANSIVALASGAQYAMLFYDACAAFSKCVCQDPRKVPQPVYAYAGNPPTGPLASTAIITSFNVMSGIVNTCSTNGTLLAAGVQPFKTAFSSLKLFYYFNDAGNLPVNGDGELQALVSFVNAVKAANVYSNSDLTITADRSYHYNMFLMYLVGEANRIYQYYDTALNAYSGALGVTVTGQYRTTLNSARTVLYYDL